MTHIPQERQGTGLPVEAGGGGGAYVRVTGSGRGRQGPLDGRTPGPDRDLCTG